MRYDPIQKDLFVQNRRRLTALLQPKSLAVVNNNDSLPTNADGTYLLHPNSDLFYLTGFEHSHAGERLLCLLLRADGSFLWIAPAMNVAQIDNECGLGGQQVWGHATQNLPQYALRVDDKGDIYAEGVDELLYGRLSNVL